MMAAMIGAVAVAGADGGVGGTAGGEVAGGAGVVAGADALDAGWASTLAAKTASRAETKYKLSRITARLPTADHAGMPAARTFICRTASRRPTKIDRATIECPMLNSANCMSATGPMLS